MAFLLIEHGLHLFVQITTSAAYPLPVDAQQPLGVIQVVGVVTTAEAMRARRPGLHLVVTEGFFPAKHRRGNGGGGRG